MATVFTVTQITGQAWIRSADGTLTLLQAGMQVPVNARIVTADGASVRLEAEGMLPITIGGGRDVVLSEELLETDIDPAEAAITPTDAAVQQVLNALEEGADPFDTLDSTSALQSASQGGHDGVTFMRMVSLIEITAPMSLVDPRSTSTIDLGEQVFGGLEESRDEFGAELSTTRPPVGPFAPAQGAGGSGTAGGGSPGAGGGNSIPGSGGGGNPGTGGGNGNPGTGNGNNSRPFAFNDDGGQILEDSSARLAGNVISNDVFRGGPVSVSWAGAENAAVLEQLAQYGTISLGANGNWRFALDNSKAATQGLAAGQVIEFNLNYVLSASGGDAAPATLSFRVIGTNDMPVISGRAAGSVQEDAASVVTGKLNITDADIGEAAFIPGRISGAYGALTIDANGNWLYTLANQQPNVQSLGAGDTATELITVQSIDGTQTQIIITISGTNDAPTITGTKTGALTEDAASTVSGKLDITDVDAGEAAFVAGIATGIYGSLTIDVEGNWAYTLAATSDAQIQALGEGVTATDRITVLSADGTPTVIEITITGVNDAPVITGTKTGALTEDAASTVSGKLNIVDVDAGESSFQSGSVVGLYGSLSIDENGNWTYKLAATSDAPIQALGEGVTATDLITVRSVDGTETQITITITGVNDAPVITGTKTGALTEDAASTVSGKLNITDVDTGEAAFVAGSATGVYGSLTIDAEGTWTYKLAATSDAQIQALGEGVTATDRITVLSADGTPTVIEITITGVNDAPVITGTKTGALTEDAASTVSGELNITDVDAGEAAFVAGSATGIYGSLTIDAEGTWTYKLAATSDAQVQALGAGVTATDLITVRSVDGTETQITITITGVNDVPVITGTKTGALTEDAASTVSGKLDITDVDAGESSFQPRSVVGTYGSLSIDEQGNWTYELAATSDAQIQALVAGVTATDRITVLSADGTPTVIEITITGVNDAPVITGTKTGALAEDAASSVSGKLNIVDVDADESSFQSGSVVGTYGSLSIDEQGSWTYKLAATSDAQIQALGEGVTATDRITVLSADGTPTVIEITITGVNDAPVITGTKTGALTEDAASTVSGKLNITDVDTGEAAFVAGSATGIYGSLTIDAEGTWTYELAATSDAQIQALGEGVTATDRVTVLSADGTPTVIEITITGVNDAPVITGTKTGALTEDAASIVSGKLNITDVDTGEAAFVAGSATGAYGSLIIDAGGNWTYTLAATSDAQIQALGAGVTATDLITVRSVDGTEAQITITITGVNDAPVITGTKTGALTEDAASTVSGKLNIVDVDAGESSFQSGSVVGTYGSLSIDENGSWTYKLAATSDAQIQALGEGVAATDLITVRSVDGTETQITITITGVNDAPTITGTKTGALTEDAASTVSGKLDIADVDADESSFQPRSVVGTYGSLSIDEQGNWTYELAATSDAQIQALGAGVTATDRITVLSADGTPTVIEITITGVNDAPVITGTKTGALTEDAASTVSGKLDIADVDAGESSFQSRSVVGAYGSLSIDEQGNWTYELAATSDAQIQALGAGVTATDRITVLSADGTPTVIEITITGVNDAPTIIGTKAGALTEDAASTVSGKLDIADVDAGESSFQSGSVVGTYGSLSIDEQGSWTYKLAATSDAQIQALGAGVTATDRITVLSADGTPMVIEITITGVNDVPTITGTKTGALTEDAASTVSGKIDIVDVDAGESSFQPGSVVGTYGSLSIDEQGSWTYKLAATSDAQIQALGAGVTATDRITVLSADGTPTMIEITITGVNDVPTITGTKTGALTEDAASIVGGKLNITDVDAGESSFQSGNVVGTYGSLSIDEQGSWTYELAATSDAQIQALGEGVTATDRITVLSADGTPTVIEITITGVNDAPTITGSRAGEVAEDGTATASGKLTIVDIDSGESVFEAATIVGTYGSLTIDAEGNWTYTLANDQTNVQSLGEGDTATDRITVLSADGTLTEIEITITGTNDYPEISGVASGAVQEDGTLTAEGQLTVSDVDATDMHIWSIQDEGIGQYGSIMVDQNGKWTYTLDNTLAQSLAANETYTESFTVEVDDGKGGTDTQEIVITITGTNDRPVVTADIGVTDEETVLTVDAANGVLANDYDPDGDTLTVREVNGATTDVSREVPGSNGGIFVVNADGSYTFKPGSDFQFLGQGQDAQTSITYTVSDGKGGFTTSTLTVTVTGTNDAPVLTVDATGALTEDASSLMLSDSGTLSITDLDVTDTHTLSSSYNNDAAWSGGSLTADQVTAIQNGLSVDASGWTYEVANSAVQFLGAGQTLTLSFDVTVTDSAQGTDTETVTITITGTNDDPEISGVASGAVQEDGTLTTEGQLTVSDADATDTHTWSIQDEGIGQYGSIMVDQNGKWTYTLDNTLAQSLAANETYTESFTVEVDDGKGGTDTQEIVITITGTNDRPVVTADTGATDEETVLTVDAANGVLANDYDPDGDTLTVREVNGALTDVSREVPGSNGGIFVILPDGSYTFRPGSDFQFLGQGQDTQTSIRYTVSDGKGGLTTSTLTVTVTGTNDAPVLTVEATGELTEDVSTPTLSDSGTLNITDLDVTDTHTLSSSYNNDAAWSGGTLTADQVTAIQDGLTVNAGGWTYEVANSAVQFLGAGQTLTLSFDVTVTDSAQGTDTQTVTITITGTNDDPEISGVASGAVQEDGTLTAEGQLTVSDVDATDTHTWSINGNDTGQYGSIAVDVDGKWTYTLDNARAQSLAADETYTETFTVQVADGQGGIDTQTITITITGTNDDPEISGVAHGAVQEDGVLKAEGQLTVSDADASDMHTWSIQGDATGAYGSIVVEQDGKWTYTLDNTLAQSLAANETRTETFAVQVADGQGGTDTHEIVITITGTNDRPVVTADTGATDEGTVLTVDAANGVLANDDDPDGDTLTVREVNGALTDVGREVPGSNGGIFVVNADGSYTFKPGSDFQFLGQGQDAQTSITYTVSDGNGGLAISTLTVTVTGTNDAPVLTVEATGALTEDASSPTLSDSGALSITDLDVTDTHTLSSSYNNDAAWSGGTLTADQVTAIQNGLTVNASGWTYAVANSAVQFLGAGQTLTLSFDVTVTDSADASHTQTVTITITGTNDDPTISGVASGAVQEDGTLTAEGQLTVSDADATDTHTWSIQGDATGQYGSIVVDQNGKWTYTLDNSLAQSLAANEAYAETFVVQVADNQGGIDTQTITLTITGTNDEPVLTVSGSGSIVEDAHVSILSVEGALSVTDFDANDTHTLSSSYNNDAAWSGGTLTADQVAAIQDGLTVSAGGWTYEVANSAVQFLGAGQTLMLSFDVTVTDSALGTDTQTVTITITGTNDVPTITGSRAGEVTEDTGTSVTGKLAIDDVDVGESSFQAGDLPGVYGSLTIDAQGNWTYTLANDQANVQSLGKGDTATDRITVLSADGTPTEIEITITGTNDDPEISGVAYGAVQEDGVLKAEGQLTVSDIDATDTHTWSIQGDATGTYGSIVVDQDGKWTYTLDNSLAQSLAANETYTESFTVEVDDGKGGTDTQEIVITITGTNDRPVVTADIGATDEDTILTVDAAHGVLANDYDPDGDALTVREVNGAITDVGREVPGSNGGIFVILPDGSYTFRPGSDFQFLGQGQDTQTSIRYTVSDGKGGLTTSTLTVTVTGTNDAPVLTVEATGALTEDVSTPTLSDSGTLNITDLDVTDTHTLSSSYNNDAAWSGGTLTADQVAAIQDGLTVNAGGWTYEVANSAVQFLGAGQTLILSFDVTVTDSAQGTDTQTVTITITGTNDDPEISGVASGAVQEDGVLKAEGQLTVSDVDASDTHTWSIQGDATGAYGTIAVDQNGKWIYTLDNTLAQGLAANETYTETFAVQVADGQGGTDTHEIVITITGTNDRPVVTADTGATDEGTVLTVDAANGVLANDYDPDGDTLTVREVNGALTDVGREVPGSNGGIFIVNADGSYTFKPGSDFQYLGQDQDAQTSITYTVSDGKGGLTTSTLIVTVTGTNDAPVLTVEATGALTEDASSSMLSDSGALSITDLDVTDTHTLSSSYNNDVAWSGGTLTADQVAAIQDGLTVNAGGWTYEVANSAVQFLGAGQTLTLSFDVTVTDSAQGTDTQTVTITITGTNDDPEISGVASGAVQEDGVLKAEGQLTVSDVDASDTHTWSIQGDVKGAYGSIVVDQNGKWTYTLDNARAQSLAANEAHTESFVVQVADNQGGIDTQTITLTITGTNDEPVLTVSGSGSIAEDAHASILSVEGALSVTDLDVNDTHTLSSSYNNDAAWSGGTLTAEQVTAIQSGLTVTADSWTYEVANSTVQFLGEGQTLTLSFDVTVTDSAQGTDTQTVTITITGTNDDPEISGVASGAVQEDGMLTAEGQLTVSDADATDEHVWSVQGDGQGDYGRLAVDAAGKWTYTLDNESVQSLAANETRTETFTVQVADGQGGTDTQTIIITVTGTNDDPVLTVDGIGSITEDASSPRLSDSGALNITDLDVTDTHTLSSSYNDDAAWSGGTLTADQVAAIQDGLTVSADGWTYEVANSAVQFLGAGQTLTLSFDVAVTDSALGTDTQTVTITITGTNDDPEISGVVSGAVQEDGTLTAEGQLTVSDADTTDTHTWSISGNAAGQYGSIAVDVDGKWIYTLDNARAQSLAADETYTETFTVQVVDGQGGTATETVTITVTGTNDAPIVEGGQAYASGFEDALLQLSWSQFNITDVDSADAALGVVITGLPADGVLFFDGAAVAAGQTISKADIDAGKLTFKPDANESGFDSHPGTGVGDQQQDYAQFTFKPTDGITEGENTNFIIDVHPISDAPNVTVTVTQGDSQPATGGGGEIIRVNGGSDAINGLGFDVVDGKIYAIGENVRIWYTNARTGSTKDGSVVHHQDFTAEEIQQIIENSLSGRNHSEAQRASLAAQMQGNFIPYTQGNANAGDAGKGKTDVFVLHENSLYEQNAQTDNQGTTYHSYSMNAGSGNGGNGNSPDFIFLKETAGVTYKVDGVVSHEWHVNEPNHNDNWTITANGKSIVSGFNQLAGLVTSSGGYFGSSGLVVPADDAPASPGYVEYEVTVVAHVSDQDGSERMGQEIVLSGLPAGSTVILANGQELIVGADGTVVLVGEFSNFEGRVGEQTQVSSEITIRVPHGSSFELQAEAKAYEAALGEQSTASGYGGSEVTAVPDVTEPGESGQPGDSEQPGGEQPGEPEALGMPTVNVTATSQGIEPGSVGITQVNGGARSANGFDIENGQIVRVGSGVVVWLSRGDIVPTDSNGNELPATQIRYYDSVNGTINGHKNYTDIFVLHEDSDLHGKVQGNRSGSHSDYVFVPDDGVDYSTRAKTNAQGGGADHNPLNQVFLSIEGNDNDFARADLIKGVIFGSGVGHEFGEAGPGDAITTIGAAEGYQRIDVTLTAAPQDAGREELLPELILTGIPAGVQVYDAAGQLLSAGANGAYVLSAERLVQNPDGSFNVNVSLRVPENAEAFDIVAHATAKLIGDDSGRSEMAFGEASISYGMDVSDPSTGDPIDYGADLLLNGDFTLYKGTPGWEEGNIYQGFREWNHVGGNFSGDEYKRMEDRPYIGVWENTARDIALTQAVEGVVAGSVVQLQVAWNNPNHGEPGNGISKPPQDTGDSMTLEISFGGVVYAQIATPSANMSVADARYAHVIGMNGATVDLDQIQTWSEQYGWYGGNTPKPDDLNVFETLNITLPPGVAGSGEFSLRWISQDEGSPYTDDIMVANVKLLLPDAPATFSALSTDDTEAFGSLLLASPEEETLFGTSGDDTFTWNDDDAGTKADPITHVVKNFGLGGDDLNGQDALDLSDLLQGEEDGTLTNYLHLESEESNGVTNTVIKVDKDGAGFSADAGGHDHRIVLENVDLHDLTGGGSQNDMLQQMIADGKLKVDQG